MGEVVVSRIERKRGGRRRRKERKGGKRERRKQPNQRPVTPNAPHPRTPLSLTHKYYIPAYLPASLPVQGSHTTLPGNGKVTKHKHTYRSIPEIISPAVTLPPLSLSSASSHDRKPLLPSVLFFSPFLCLTGVQFGLHLPVSHHQKSLHPLFPSNKYQSLRRGKKRKKRQRSPS